MSTSDAQQNRDAQLKQAFQKHLPHRIAAVQRRLRALCDGGWDINTLHLTYLEIESLAGSAGSYGLIDVSNRLFSLENRLSGFMESGEVPDASEGESIRQMIGTLNSYSADADNAPSTVQRERRMRMVRAEPPPEPEIDVNGLPSLANVPHWVSPPAGFLPDSSLEDVALDESPAEPGSSEAELEEELESFGSDLPDADDEPVDTDELEPWEEDLVPDDGAVEDAEADGGEAETPSADIDAIDRELPAEAEKEAEQAEEADADVSLGDIGEKLITGTEVYEVYEPDDIDESDLEELEDLDALFESVESDLQSEEPESPPPGPAVEPAASAGESGKLTVYFLHGTNDLARQLEAMLGDDYEIESFDDPAEFMEVLNAIGPDAVMVDETHLDRIEEIGPVVRKLRAKTHSQLPLVAMSAERDVATRLRLMRAGADAFLSADAPVDEISDRISEMLNAAPEDPYRVLIVEDDHSQALFAQSILRRAGLEVRTERDPLRVMNVLEEFRPDLILMDLHMPDCDGMELTAIIRERDDFVNTPIVFLSGEDDEDTHFDALLAGGDDFLSKPIRPRHLISAVKNRVRRARAVSRPATARAPRMDTVTGLVDRPALLDQINAQLAGFEPEQDERPGGVIYFEIDRPYELRREIGLPGFESLTHQLGPLLTEDLRVTDVAARYGDNAYCLLLPGRSLTALERRATQSVENVAGYRFELDGKEKQLTISAGICPLATHFADAAAVIGAAERACNADSENEIQRIGVHRVIGQDQHQDVREMGAMILDALDYNRFQLVYQPIASLQGDEVEQYQCLLRLPREGGATISPQELIQAGEELGMLDQIDRWVLKKSLAVLAGSSDRDKPLRLFVNQSLAATRDAELPEWLMKSMESRQVPGSSLVMEFKLPEIVSSLKSAVQFMDALVPRRIRFCLGQFNGSETAFRVLEHFTAEFVKLSPELVLELVEKEQLRELIERLHSANAQVIVPAVEEADAAVTLWSSGVDYIQGNFVQEPESDLNYQFANAL